MMVDEDVAYVTPSSVYRTLSDADLLYRWKRSRKLGQPPPEPTRMHRDVPAVDIWRNGEHVVTAPLASTVIDWRLQKEWTELETVEHAP